MPVKYHVNPKTQQANKCDATKRPCPLGANAPHFATKEEAREYITANAAAENPTFSTLKKPSPNLTPLEKASQVLAERQEVYRKASEEYRACARWKRLSRGGRRLEVVVPKKVQDQRRAALQDAKAAVDEAREAEYALQEKAPAYESRLWQAFGLAEAQQELIARHNGSIPSTMGGEIYLFAPSGKMEEITASTINRYHAGETLPHLEEEAGNYVPYRDKLLYYLHENEAGAYLGIAFPENDLAPVLDKLEVNQVSVSAVANGRENGLAYTVMTPTGDTRTFTVVEHRNTDSLVIHGKTNWNPASGRDSIPYASDSKNSWFAEYAHGEYRRAAETLGYFLKEAQEGRLESDEELMKKAEGLDWVAILDEKIPGFASWANEQELKRREAEEREED